MIVAKICVGVEDGRLRGLWHNEQFMLNVIMVYLYC